tara:strand:+ start:343 stop:588 length:246 start_codon:yes stop_codon:yes gene_type:complete
VSFKEFELKQIISRTFLFDGSTVLDIKTQNQKKSKGGVFGNETTGFDPKAQFRMWWILTKHSQRKTDLVLKKAHSLGAESP